jgi:hypothetical protein
VRKEGSQGTLVTPAKKKKLEKPYRNSRIIFFNEIIRSGIRKKVHEMFIKNIPPTLKSILTAVNIDDDLPNFKRTTLYRLLIDIGFIYEKRGKRSILIEKDDIIRWRHKYLREVRKEFIRRAR